MAYSISNSGGFYFVHDPESFEPVCGFHAEKRDAIKARDLLNMTIAASDPDVYENRSHIAASIESLRWDVRELSDHPETRARACSLRDLLNIIESRLLQVTRP